MLDLGDQDLVAGLDRAGQRERDQVDGLGRTLGEYDLLRLGADEPGDLRPRLLVDRSGFLTQQVGAAVGRGVVPLVVLPLGVQYLNRVLRGRAGVQVDERLSVAHRAREDREILANRLRVQRAGHDVPTAVVNRS